MIEHEHMTNTTENIFNFKMIEGRRRQIFGFK